MTCEGWFYFKGLSSFNQCLFSHGNDTGNGRSFTFSIASTTTTDIRTSTSPGSAYITGTTVTISTLSINTWYHIAFVYTAAAGSVQVFLNGISQGTSTGLNTSLFATTAPFRVGQLNDGGGVWFFNGYTNLCRVWKATRTALQITTNYCTELGATTNLEAEWTFNNTGNDNSGNSNTMSLVGSPTYVTQANSTCPLPAATLGNFLIFM